MKVSGSVASLVQGVSQQDPQDRRSGQHGAVVNMIPDPVLGLARRHGSEWLAETLLGTDSNFDACSADAAKYRSFEYTNGGSDFALLYRPTAKAAGSTLGPVIAYNKTTREFVPVVVVPGPLTSKLADDGISAIVATGRYVYMAGHSIIPTGTATDVWGSASNQRQAVAWIRGGAYARTYTITATKASTGLTVSVSYTTPTSSYPGTLDTSGVPVYAQDPSGTTLADTEAAYIVADGAFGKAALGWAAWSPTGLTVKDGGTLLTNVFPADPASASEYSWDAGAPTVRFHSSLIGDTNVTLQYTHLKTIANPNYAKSVGDLTAAYNSAVTQWIGTAAAAIAPAAIAEQLRLLCVGVGLPVTRRDSTLGFDNVSEVIVTDGGDGSLVRGVDNVVPTIDQVSIVHYAGKVVRVQAPDSADGYYMKAVPKTEGATGLTDVTWVEGAGSVQAITSAFCYGTMYNGTFYIADNATALGTVVPGTHPDFNASTTGDQDTSPLPFFVGKKISYLGVFQDRLLIGAGSVIQCSETGEYLNMFPGSALTVVGSDAYELQSQGTEDDEIRYSVLYDRDLVLFGKERQYVIPGRVPMSPLNAAMPVMSKHTGAADTPPVTSGAVIFYAKQGTRSTSVHQIQPGQVAESPESYLASSQLDDYIPTGAVEVLPIAKPTVIVLRTAMAPSSLFLFHYLDQQDGRRQDAWHSWEFAPEVGVLCGMIPEQDNLVAFSLRKAGGSMFVVADSCSMVGNQSEHPYFDSQRTFPNVPAGSLSITPASVGNYAVAFDTSTQYQYIGDTLANYGKLLASYPTASGLRVGIPMTGMFEPTNPFIMDKYEQAITTGRLTISKLLLDCRDSSGFRATLRSGGTSTEQVFNARIIDSPTNLIGRVPVGSFSTSIPIGKETNSYALTIASIDWLPLTLTNIQWVGQFFNRPQRI